MILGLSIIGAILIQATSSAAIRGTWFTISGTQAPYSELGIQAVVEGCQNIGINTIYFSVWDESMINFEPTPGLLRKYPFLKMNPKFKINPLQILIDKAHAFGIKVVAWFEYGFATSYNDPDTGGPILKANPQWRAINQKGDLVSKNNFQWMNGFHPEVQQLMIDLINEVTDNYAVDGIQGDDRLPAMPSMAGYDEYTRHKYRLEHAGAEPPANERQQQWVLWRCDILNSFMQAVYQSVKGRSKEVQVHMSPSTYPWSKYEYLQDWPTWVSRGWVDAVMPQIYRYDISQYRDTLEQNLKLVD